MLIIKMLKKKDPDNNFVKLWENKRYHALVCLGLWFIFFIFVFLIVVIPYKNALKNLPKNNETENITTFASMKEKLLNGEYNYKYTVNIYNDLKQSCIIMPRNNSANKYNVIIIYFFSCFVNLFLG